MSGPRYLALVFAAALAASPALAGGCDSPARTNLDASFVRDMRAKDFAVLRLYTVDAVFVNPDGARVSGAKSLRRLYRTVFSTYDSDLRLEPKIVSALAQGRLECVEAGAYTEDLRTRATGQVQHAHGRYRFTSRQGAGGRWRFSRMEWLSD